MNAIDVAVGAIVLVLGLRGYFRGFFREVFGLAAWLGGSLASVLFAAELAPRVGRALAVPVAIAEALAGIGIFVSIYVSCRILGWLFSRLARALLLASLDRVGGLAFGVAKGVCMCAVLLLVFDSRRGVPMVSERIQGSWIGSELVRRSRAVIQDVRGEAGFADNGEAPRSSRSPRDAQVPARKAPEPARRK